MQNIMALANTQTMTSVEVVEVINSLRPETASVLRHDHFMTRCERIGEELATPSLRGTYTDVQGKVRPCYLLDKETCLILVASESAKVMQAIIRRWQELEEIQRQALPQTHIQAVEAYLNTLKTVEAQEKQLGIQQKVIDHKNIKTDCSDTHFTIKRIRALNQGMKIDPKILLRVCETLGNGVETVYDHYDQAINQYSREVWEEAYPDAILPE